MPSGKCDPSRFPFFLSIKGNYLFYYSDNTLGNKY